MSQASASKENTPPQEKLSQNKLLKKLQGYLDQSIAGHKELFLLLEKELEENQSSQKFLEIQTLKQKKAQELFGLEKERLKVVRLLENAWEMPEAQLKLTHIGEKAPKEFSDILLEQRQELLDITEKLTKIGQESRRQAENKNKVYTTTLNVIAEASRLHPIYSGKGRLKKKIPSFKQTTA